MIYEPASAVADQPMESGPRAEGGPASHWWRIADFGVLGVWIAIVSFTLSYHEKWLDEAQAWLFARDLDLRTIWFHELRYEGSPGLWHTILWVAQHVFHAKYGALGWIGMAGATAGVALLIFKAPFPRYIRWPLAFTYFMVYQYAVIARQYTLIPLLAFAAAALFNDIRHPERLTVVLILLANTSFHGTVLGGCFGLFYLVDASRSWAIFSSKVRLRYWLCIACMALTFVFVYIVLKPPPDSGEILRKQGLFGIPGSVNDQGNEITRIVKLRSIISGAFLDYALPSIIFLLLATLWCFLQRRFLLFLVSVGSMLALYSLLYGTVHHQGIAFVAAIAVLWIAWPTAHEQAAFQARERLAFQGMIALFLSLCAVNTADSIVVIHRDYLYPYSGAEDAARYLKAVGAERGRIFGYGFGISGVQAYFDHNILSNIPSSYTHNGSPGWALRFDQDQVEKLNPGYLVVSSADPQATLKSVEPLWTALGYEMVHFSDGYYLYKRSVYEREAYLIFRRLRPSPPSLAPALAP